LDALMIANGLNHLPLMDIRLLIIENVGNLVCPSGFKLGEHINVLVASTPEGDDKPYKYPNVYKNIRVLIINKMDLLPYVHFDMDNFRRGVELLNPGLQTFAVSCITGQGIQEWTSWLKSQILQRSPDELNSK
jgi:hydrogenase nickel incorporation protein HypB